MNFAPLKSHVANKLCIDGLGKLEINFSFLFFLGTTKHNNNNNKCDYNQHLMSFKIQSNYYIYFKNKFPPTIVYL